jgi:DNA-directed RNA polymerase specialized sigma24 family protein
MYPARATDPERRARQAWVAPECHEEVFVERYDWLRKWAVTITGDPTRADDLLHTAFVQFVLARKSLTEIANVEAYLYGMLRCLHLSERRKAQRAPEESLSAIDYESIELTLQQTEPREYLQVCEELRAICHYACQRKDSSKAGSVLLLRFFHGYYPTEIAAILRSRVPAANDWLRIARGEAQAFLRNPVGVGPAATRANGASSFDAPGLLLGELSQSIRESCTGTCFDAATIDHLYGGRGQGHLPCEPLAHIASCPPCRDAVTRRLNLAPPDDRGFGEMLGQDPTRRGNGHSGSGGARVVSFRAESLRRMRDVVEHIPSKLQIVVNGAPIGVLAVGSRRNEVSVAITGTEPPASVEIFSEQGVRMLFMPVAMPPAGSPEQSIEVNLSTARQLTTRIRFDGARPIVSVLYLDPEGVNVGEAERETADVRSIGSPPFAVEPVRTHWAAALAGSIRNAARLFAARPAFAVGVVIAMAVTSWMFWRETPVAASGLLRDTMRAEQLFVATPNTVVHRIIQMEERRLPSREVVARHRIESWSSGGRVARRLFDEGGTLIAGDWITGARRITYMPGVAPTIEPADSNHSVEASRVWRLEPSAETFRALVPDSLEPTVEDKGDRYVVAYASTAGSAAGVMSATLTIPKDGLRAVEQVLRVREGDAVREYQFVETAATRVAESLAPATVFEPETELLGPRTAAVAPPITAPATLASTAPPTVPALAADELTRIEMRTLIALHRFETCLGGPAAVSVKDQAIEVAAPAVDAGCRDRIEQALSSGNDRRWIRLAWGAQTPDAGVRLPEIPESQVLQRPAYRALYDRFNSSGNGNAALMGALGVGQRALERARVIDTHARELQRLVLDWPVARLRLLDLDTAAAWQSMVRDHARVLASEADRLKSSLATVMVESGTKPVAVSDFDLDKMDDVRHAVEQIAGGVAASRAGIEEAFGPVRPRDSGGDLTQASARLAEAAAFAVQFERPWAIGW